MGFVSIISALALGTMCSCFISIFYLWICKLFFVNIFNWYGFFLSLFALEYAPQYRGEYIILVPNIAFRKSFCFEGFLGRGSMFRNHNVILSQIDNSESKQFQIVPCKHLSWPGKLFPVEGYGSFPKLRTFPGRVVFPFFKSKLCPSKIFFLQFSLIQHSLRIFCSAQMKQRPMYAFSRWCNLNIIFWGEFLVRKLTILERFTSFGTNIHPWRNMKPAGLISTATDGSASPCLNWAWQNSVCAIIRIPFTTLV